MATAMRYHTFHRDEMKLNMMKSGALDTATAKRYHTFHRDEIKANMMKSGAMKCCNSRRYRNLLSFSSMAGVICSALRTFVLC